jgi:hypothetical protein
VYTPKNRTASPTQPANESRALLEPLTGSRDIEQFDPERYRLRNRALDFSIEEAKRIKDWPTLEHAIDAKIGEQHKFVAWWNANVRNSGNPQLTAVAVNYITVPQAQELTGMRQQRVSDLGKRLANAQEYREHLLGAEYRAAFLEAPGNVRGTGGTGEFERYTPAQYIEAARLVLGEIDLDPASCDLAQQTVRATNYFTLDGDGLAQEWHGRVWLNPPYHEVLGPKFINKLIEEIDAGHVTAAIMLTNNSTDTEWFQDEILSFADAICFTRGRVKFYKPTGENTNPKQGQAFSYFGRDVQRFKDVFGRIGKCWRRSPGYQPPEDDEDGGASS